MTYSHNPNGEWTAKHQMTMNGKRDGFTLSDFRACEKSARMKRGRATAIIEEVRSAVLRWQDFATHAQVTDNWVPQIQNSFRLEIPNGS
jgi:serine/threonine-protein kinase HipA